ncbi:hypothetical protein BGW37DRAFT_508385 [Umbelopsis sp. PMI_123]|nr:hypothetical protein BGW37DRAFT_508385 [Umbelopsis sp. PMI_123]
MSEFWVSQQRHWCQYCKKYITNNKPSISIHESGKAHKDMVEKFLRDVYKRGKESQKEKAEVQKELERIEQVAISSYNSKDAGGGPKIQLPTVPDKVSSKSTKSAVKPKQAAPPKQVPAEPFEMPTPRQPRSEAAPGEWTIVSKPVESIKEVKASDANRPTTTHDLKPELQDEFAADEEDLRSYKIKEKSYPEDAYVEDTDDKKNEGVVFKKRKLGGQGKGRNIRKK